MDINVERHEEDHTYRVIFKNKHEMDLILGGIKLYQSTWKDKAGNTDQPELFHSIEEVIGNMIAEMELDSREMENGEVVCRFSDMEMAGILKTMLVMMAAEMNEVSRLDSQLRNREETVSRQKVELELLHSMLDTGSTVLQSMKSV